MLTLGTTGISVREWAIEAKGGGETPDISAGGCKKEQIWHTRKTGRVKRSC